MNHETHHESSTAVSNALGMLAVGGVVVAGGVMLAPHVLPALGFGSEELAATALRMHADPGIAGTINQAIGAVPYIGSRLAEGGFFTAITSGLIGTGGMLIGDKLANGDNAIAAGIGPFIKYGALATSALIALPTVLTAIGAGIIFLSTLGGDMALSGEVASVINSTLGTMSSNHPMMGMPGFGAIVPHLLTCGTPLLPAALGMRQWNEDKEEALEAFERKPKYHFIARGSDGVALDIKDPNHFMTQEEFAMVQEYNQAKPAQKILLKKKILEHGYEPDFHPDGTVHLYKHDESAHSMAR